MLGILLAGIAPGLALLSYFYLKGKSSLEPISMVLRMFVFGAFLVFPTAFIEYILKTENVVKSEFFSAFFSSGMVEEFSKWSILYVAVYLKGKFKRPYEGIVYGSSISLGFATAENLMYLFVNGWEYALHRALLPVSSHALFGVIMGYYVGIANFSIGLKWVWMILSLLIPTFLHGIYNYILLSQNSWITTMVPYMFLLWWIGMKKVQMAEIIGKKLFVKPTTLKESLSLI